MILLGPPASGKGTQGRLIAERWQIAVTSIGEMLRRETAACTPLGLEADQYTAHGKLVPDWIALNCVESWLAQHGSQFIFDGFPRTVGQAQALEKLLERRQTRLTAVIWLELDESAIREGVSKRVVCSRCGNTFRLGWQVESLQSACPVCGHVLTIRHDDQPETLAERMLQYREHTEPLIHFYERRGLLRRIKADDEADTVFAHIEAAISAGTEATV